MPETQPTIVLVHGGFIDGSSRSGVVAPANRLPAEPVAVAVAAQRPIAAAHPVGRRS